MTPRLVLHVGDPKTGSSSIQKILFDGAWQCDTLTLDYPHVMNAFLLASALKSEGQDDRRFAPYVTWLDDSTADVAVISAETFALHDPLLVAKVFQRHFPDHADSMQVVAYVRPHISRFLSAYVQRTKVGMIDCSLSEFFESMRSKKLLNFHTRFAKWREVFGSRFVLRPMERGALRDGDVVADFLGIALQDAPFRITAPTDTNSSMQVEGLAGLRFMHRTLKPLNLGAETHHLIGARINTLVTEAGGVGTKLRITQAMYDLLLFYCHQDATRLDRDFFDSAVMSSALKRAARDTVPKSLDWAAEQLYPIPIYRKLRRITKRLGALFEAAPGVWEADYRLQRGYNSDLVPPEAAGLGRAIVDETEAILAEAASILASFAQQAKGTGT